MDNAWQDIWNDTNYAVQLGERKCRKLRMGAHGFSDKWAQIIQELDFWSLRIAQIQGRKTLVWSMLRLARQAGLLHLTNTDLATALECQSQVKKRKRLHK